MPSPTRPRRRTAFMVAIAMLVAAPLAVVADDRFDDVPDSNVFHDDITWLADADVTRGCNPPENSEFCPSDNVTREQMAAFMRRLAENQVVDAATAQRAGTAYQAVRAESVSLASAPTSDSAESIVTLADLPAGAYVVTASWGASRNGTDQSRVVCHLTGGSEDVRSIQSTGGDPGFALQNSMASTMAVSLDEGSAINLSCHAEQVNGVAPNIIDARIVAYPALEIISVTVTE